ncbi:MAG: type II toxin-antitoxin system Phd/YefM family antitoxin [Cyanobacteriota bacterium]
MEPFLDWPCPTVLGFDAGLTVQDPKALSTRLIDAAHAGETILVAKDGKPRPQLVPLNTDQSRRQPGLPRGQLHPSTIVVVLAPLPPEERDALDVQWPSRWHHPSCSTPMPWRPSTFQRPRSL